MKRFENIRVYAWVEFVIWLLILACLVIGFRYHRYQEQKQYKNYQIFMEDVDGLIVGSPVKFLGIQIGYVKKIEILSTEVYVKFIITQKDLILPTGSIATVEASGLGGSKALEIYPPNSKNPTDKIIAVKDPTRLSKVMGLFDNMFRELDAIIVSISGAVSDLDLPEKTRKNVVTPVDTNAQLDSLNKSLDNIIKAKDNFMKNFRENKGE